MQALTPTTIDIAGGGMTILLGPSGCGKTTMLRLIAGLVAPTSGIIEIGGVNLWANGRRNSEALSHLGMVFQDANLFPWLTIEQNIALPLKLRGVKKSDRLAKAQDL
ncbi:MAG: ATP-binding cassette domain-containing protein, partial [Rhizobiaceae bacterium]|nr:ATP-binding cassette domain-containing protein [Rhizobiaceae bacterium]